MKKIISSVLIFSFLFYSMACNSFYPLDNDEKLDDYLKSDVSLLFILKNNETVKATPHNLLLFSEPKDFISGVGNLINTRTGKSKYFKGEIRRENIDSIKSIIVDSQKYYIYWFNDSLRVAFEEGEFIDLVPEQNSGFWLVLNENRTQILEKIYIDNINEIQVAKTNYIITTLLLIPFITLLVIVYFVSLSNPNWGNAYK